MADKQMTKKQGLDALRKNPAMAHLIEALEAGKDIGHYGRLTFAMVARHFLEDDALAKLLAQDKDFGEEQAAGLVNQVNEADYSPPGPGKIRKWQGRAGLPDPPRRPRHDRRRQRLPRPDVPRPRLREDQRVPPGEGGVGLVACLRA